uniref:Ubiquitin-associated-domain-containing protein n=1 Tax=uncultured bacterium Contig90 TaxID=1393628 RepID=W0FQW0_9BACT|nr:ubiquitin-associated- domain-containing protein [uncultured bacterium Contig90]
MEPYTIEDIELLRKKSGLSYQEAVNLLDYHSGSLARALIDLEKHGRLKEEDNNGKEGTRTMSDNTKRNETKEKALGLLQKLYRSRVKIRKGDTNVFNVSVLFSALCLLLAPHMTIAGVIVSMILGYQFSFTGMDPDFASDSLEKMVKSAAQNAKSSVSSVVNTISTETKELQKKAAVSRENAKQSVPEKKESAAPASPVIKESSDPAESIRKQAKELEETMDSFFDNNPSAGFNSAYSAAASSVPTIQVPVQTETRDGEVTTEDDQDGYSSVTIG